MSVKVDGKFKKADLLALPELEWGKERGWWRSLLIVPTRLMHDSGFAHIAIIGVDSDGLAHNILAMPDDISWPPHSGGPSGYPWIRTDAYYPSGVLRVWSHEYDFSVSMPISSVDILIRKKVRA